MSNADKNILITPNRGSAVANPKIEFVGANSSISGKTISLNMYPVSNGTLSFEGSTGQLFSITNDLSNTIFSVNDISGIPSISVTASGLISLAEFGGNVLIGTSTDTGGRLQVSGNVSILDSLTVSNVAVLSAISANSSLGTSGQVLTSNGAGIYWATATGVTGTLPVSNGGTGANTLTGVLIGNGTSAFTTKTNPTGAFVGTTDTQTLTNKTAEKLILNDGFTEEVFAITDGATVDLDPNNGSIQTWMLEASRTPGQANWAAGQSITLMVDDGSAFTITWTTLSVVWKTDGGVAPTLNTSGFTVIALWKVGTTIYGARVGDS